MRPVLAIAAVELRRFLADRSNVFFVFLFPLLLVLVVGSQFGAGAAAGTVVVAAPDGALRTALTDRLGEAVDVVTAPDADAVRAQVARGRADVGLVADAAATDAWTAGRDVTLTMLPGTSAQAQVVVQQVRTAVQAMSLEQGAVAALVGAGVDPADARGALAATADEVTPPSVEVESVDELSRQFAGLGRFDLGAASQLLLFTFLASVAGSATLIQARRLGVMARTLAAPVSTAQAVGGQALGRLVIAFFQGAYIMAATAVLFRVDWGDLGLSLLVLLLFAAVAAGAAMVVGTVMDNDGAATGVGIGLGLVLAALGGAMLPLELFPQTLRTVANATPHAWAYEAFAEIQRRDGGLLDVAPQLGVLALFAAGTLLLGARLLRRSLARAI